MKNRLSSFVVLSTKEIIFFIYIRIYKFKSQKISTNRKNIDEFIVDEIQIKVGSQYIWPCIAIESDHSQILRQMDISFERTMQVAEQFTVSTIKKYGKQAFNLNRDGGTWYPHQACKFLKLKHHFNPSFGKSIIELTM